MTPEEFDNIQVGDRFYYQWGKPPQGEENYPVSVENRIGDKLILKLEDEFPEVVMTKYRCSFIDSDITLVPIEKHKIKRLPYEAGII